MKQASFFIILVLLNGSLLFAQKPTTLKYSHYEVLSFNAAPSETGDFISIAAANIASIDTAKKQVWFGILYSRITDKRMTFVEIMDGEAKRSIKKISVDEFFSKAIIAENGATMVYSFKAGNTTYTLNVAQSMKDDRTIPSGKKMTLTFSVQGGTGKLAVKYYGKAVGTAAVLGQSLTIMMSDKSAKFSPAIVIHGEGNAVVTIAKNAAQAFTVTGAGVDANAQAPVVALELSIVGTSVPFNDNAVKQMNNIVNYFSGKTNIPDLSANTVITPERPTPNDTMTYTIIYHNIGSGPAADITIENPIPANTIYVEGSAMGAGSEISVQRTQETLPKIGTVKSISWNFKEPIYPGEQREAKFKVFLK